MASRDTTTTDDMLVENPSDFVTIGNLTKFTDIAEYDDKYRLLVSDAETHTGQVRYLSKQVSFKDLANALQHTVYYDTVGVGEYLRKKSATTGINYIFDLVYSVVARIGEIEENLGQETKIAAQPYQVVLIYNEDATTQLNDNYILPAGYKFTRLTSVFLRGTTFNTQYNSEVIKGVSPTGGYSTVSLTPNNFPQHQHYSCVINNVNRTMDMKEAISTSEESDETDRVGNGVVGSLVSRKDVRTGGIEHGDSAGTGSCEFSSQAAGTPMSSGMPHDNTPPYIMVNAFVVVPTSA